MTSNYPWLVVYSTRGDTRSEDGKCDDRVGVSIVNRHATCMRTALDALIEERNRKEVRGRSDWYCLCIIHGFTSRFTPAILRKELASTVVPNLGPTQSVLAKIEKVLSRNKLKTKNIQLQMTNG